MKEVENKEPQKNNENTESKQKHLYFNEETSESLFTKADSDRDLKSNSVILDNHSKSDLNKSLIDNLDENTDNNKSQDDIQQKNVSLGMRSSTVSNKKNSFKNNFNNINRKKKSIYFGIADNAVKINVLGSEGKNIYGKMTNFVDKFQKNANLQEPIGNNRKGSLDQKSIYPKAQNNLNNIQNNNNFSGRVDSKVALSPIHTNRRKSRAVTSVRTQLPKHEMIKNTIDLKQKLEFEEAQRAAIIMRKLEYSKGTSYKKNKINKPKENNHHVIHPNHPNIHGHNHHNHHNHHNKDEDQHLNDSNENLIILNKKNSFGQIIEEEENEVDYDNLYNYKYLIDTAYFKKYIVIRIQRWWRKKYVMIMKIKFIQHCVREFLLNKKYPKEFQKFMYLLFNLNSMFKRIEKKLTFRKIMSHFNIQKDLLPKIIKIQRKIKLHLNFNKQRKYDKLKIKLDTLNKLLLKLSLKDENLRQNLLKFFGIIKAPEINEFHEIKLDDANKITEINKPIGNNIQIDKDSINVEMEEKSVKSIRSNKKEYIVNSLENIDSVLNNSNKSKKIVLKTSSRDFINDENTENKLTKVSSDRKLKTSEDIINSKLEKVKAKKIKYVIDDEDVNSTCYSRSCKCNIY